MTITRFEDIHAWQAARELCKIVYRLTRNEKFSRDFGLVDQARRAAVSIMANIAEGFDCRSNQNSFNFFITPCALLPSCRVIFISLRTKIISPKPNLPKLTKRLPESKL